MDDNLRNNWRNTHINEAASRTTSSIMSDKHNTALQNLAKRYKRFASIGFIFACIWAPSFGMSPVLPDKWRLPIIIYGIVYFLFCAIIDTWLYNGIKSINCATMTVNTVANKAMYYRKRHLQSMILLLPMALLFVGTIASVTTDDPYFLIGAIAGFVIGLIIGLRQFFAFMTDYKALT